MKGSSKNRERLKAAMRPDDRGFNKGQGKKSAPYSVDNRALAKVLEKVNFRFS